MRHKWIDYDASMGRVVMQCQVCGGYRYRDARTGVRIAVGGGYIYIDGTGDPALGRWLLDASTPRSCPGAPLDDVTEPI